MKQQQKGDAVQSKQTERRSQSSFGAPRTFSNLNPANQTSKNVPIDDTMAKKLTAKSFLIDLKELLFNLIDYSDLFYAREHMVKTIFREEKPIVNRLSSKSALGLITVNENNNNSPTINSNNNNRKVGKVIDFDRTKSNLESNSSLNWKSSLPNVYNVLESYMTTSYRDTIKPPLSSKVKYTNKNMNDLRNQIRRAAYFNRKYSSISFISGTGSSVTGSGHVPNQLPNNNLISHFLFDDNSTIDSEPTPTTHANALNDNSLTRKKSSIDSVNAFKLK